MKSKSSVKVPDGKLVKIEVEYDDKIEDVKIRGDFFIQPPEALEELENAVEGLEKDASEQDIMLALESVDADLIGFSAEHVAEALKEAVEPDFRIINEGRFSEPMHHAIDEVLVERLENGDMKPTLRFWYRENTSIPMGRFQAYEDEVQPEFVEENDIDVVRRVTGGGAMFAEPGKVITYSLYMPKEDVPNDVEESYEELDRWAVETLQDLGLDVQYVPLNDIEHEEGKIGGAAQVRKQNAVLHHTMMSHGLDTLKMLKALRIGKEKVSDKAIKSAEKRVARISDHVEHDREEIIESLIRRFKHDYDAEEGSLTDEELEEAQKLAEEKFMTDEWNKKL